LKFEKKAIFSCCHRGKREKKKRRKGGKEERKEGKKRNVLVSGHFFSCNLFLFEISDFSSLN
jgi:hypothetical protein